MEQLAPLLIESLRQASSLKRSVYLFKRRNLNHNWLARHPGMQSIYNRRKYDKNRDERLIYQKIYYQDKSKDLEFLKKKREQSKASYRINKDKKLAHQKKYYSDPHVKLARSLVHKAYRKKHLQEEKEQHKIYYIRNREHIRQRNKILYQRVKPARLAYKRHRMATDLEFRLTERLRTRVNMSFKAKDIKKLKHADEYGINYHAIVAYLGTPPTDGVYQIDHIRPLASFDFSDPEQIRAAFSPENHQWLLAEENIAKNSSYNGKLVRRTPYHRKNIRREIV